MILSINIYEHNLDRNLTFIESRLGCHPTSYRNLGVHFKATDEINRSSNTLKLEGLFVVIVFIRGAGLCLDKDLHYNPPCK